MQGGRGSLLASEGFDLHRYCRHIIHYELDPSPMRTIQRNGPVRRVDCWAARTGKPLVIGYPVFRGTRDERLVETMQRRLTQFDLLLGGIGSDIQKEASDPVASPSGRGPESRS
jgi:ERCC4-related helicase